MRPQDARKPAEAAGDDESDIFVQPGIVAENLHAQLALANSRETPSERRLDEDVHRQQRYGKESKHQIKEGDLVREVDAEVGPATQIDPVVAAGQRVPSVGQSPHALPEREG